MLFNIFLLNRNLKAALHDAEYYNLYSNLKPENYFGNFLKISRNPIFGYYLREHSMKKVFQNAKNLTDILINARISVTKVRDFVQKINFTLDFEEHEVPYFPSTPIEAFNNAINLLDMDSIEEEIL